MSKKIIVETSLAQQLEIQGLYWETLTPSDPDSRAPRYLCRYDAGAWFAIEPDRGSQGLTRKEACRRAILGAEDADADFIEVAVKPRDEDVFFTAGLPPRKGTTRRDVFLVTKRTDPRDPNRQPHRIPFRSVKRTLWAWCATHSGQSDIHEIGERGGIGDCLYQVPRDLEIDVPAELEGAAHDRRAHWETIARRMADEQLETTLAADIDTAKIAKAALVEYRKTFVEAPIPELVSKWSDEARAAYVSIHEHLVCTGKFDRYVDAPSQAIRSVAESYAADVIRGVRTL